MFGRELGDESDGAVDRAEEDAALRRHRRLAQILHDERTVAENVDELAEVEKADLLQVLPIFVRRRRRVLLTREQIVRVFRPDESVVVKNLDGRHPVGIEVLGFVGGGGGDNDDDDDDDDDDDYSDNDDVRARDIEKDERRHESRGTVEWWWRWRTGVVMSMGRGAGV